MRRREGLSKGDRRERAILTTARTLLAARPMSQITIDDLAAGAGISRSSFYFYFDSKLAVLRALLDGIGDQMAADTADWLCGESSDEDSLRRSLATSVRLWREHGPLLRQALVADDPDPELRAFRERIVDGFVVKAAQRIQRDRDTGAAPPGPEPEALARALVQMKFAVLSTSAGDDTVVDTLATIMQRAIYGTVR